MMRFSLSSTSAWDVKKPGSDGGVGSARVRGVHDTRSAVATISTGVRPGPMLPQNL
jgi:hypothetical protein